MRRNPRAGLFIGFWTDCQGRKLRRIRRAEYGELYRLVALGRSLGLHKEGRQPTQPAAATAAALKDEP